MTDATRYQQTRTYENQGFLSTPAEDSERGLGNPGSPGSVKTDHPRLPRSIARPPSAPRTACRRPGSPQWRSLSRKRRHSSLRARSADCRGHSRCRGVFVVDLRGPAGVESSGAGLHDHGRSRSRQSGAKRQRSCQGEYVSSHVLPSHQIFRRDGNGRNRTLFREKRAGPRDKARLPPFVSPPPRSTTPGASNGKTPRPEARREIRKSCDRSA